MLQVHSADTLEKQKSLPKDALDVLVYSHTKKKKTEYSAKAINSKL